MHSHVDCVTRYLILLEHGLAGDETLLEGYPHCIQSLQLYFHLLWNLGGRRREGGESREERVRRREKRGNERGGRGGRKREREEGREGKERREGMKGEVGTCTYM